MSGLSAIKYFLDTTSKYVYLHSIVRKKRAAKTGAANRRGIPFTVYLRTGQAKRLRDLSRGRHVAKSELVRIAIDRFLAHLEKNGSTDSFGLSS